MDKWSYRVVVITICSCLIILSIGGLNIATKSGDIPVQIAAIVIAGLGYLGGLLTPTPKN